MAYRKLGMDNKHRRSMLATMTKQLIQNEKIVTTETRAKEVRKCFDKMITYGKNGSLVSRRLALAFLHNDEAVVSKVFGDYKFSKASLQLGDLANSITKAGAIEPDYKERNGGYTRIIKMSERKGDNALQVILELV